VERQNLDTFSQRNKKRQEYGSKTGEWKQLEETAGKNTKEKGTLG
jgi:hypothetical protein